MHWQRYECNNEGYLLPVNNRSHFFVDIGNYIATIAGKIPKKDTPQSEHLFIPSPDLRNMANLLCKYFIS